MRGIGLSGQMHGATLLDADDQVLRPAILWNDGRSARRVRRARGRAPDAARITGNIAMPGFTAPKLLWVREHEPEVFGAVARVLLPKDYVRLRMTGEHVAEMSDAAGTLWLDVGAARLVATNCSPRPASTREHMPRLVEGTAPSGDLRRELAGALGHAAAASSSRAARGDNAAAALRRRRGRARRRLRLARHLGRALRRQRRHSRPNPPGAVHAFCHALPGTWHQMGVMLSAAGSLDWLSRHSRPASAAELAAEVGDASRRRRRSPSCPTSRASARRTTTPPRAAPSSGLTSAPARAT